MNNSTQAEDSPQPEKRPLAISILYWVERIGLHAHYRRFVKQYRGQDDAWWMGYGEKTHGPYRFEEILKMVVEGFSPVMVLHDSLAGVEPVPWKRISYQALWSNPKVERPWTLCLRFLVALVIYLFFCAVTPFRFHTEMTMLYWALVCIWLLAVPILRNGKLGGRLKMESGTQESRKRKTSTRLLPEFLSSRFILTRLAWRRILVKGVKTAALAAMLAFAFHLGNMAFIRNLFLSHVWSPMNALFQQGAKPAEGAPSSPVPAVSEAAKTEAAAVMASEKKPERIAPTASLPVGTQASEVDLKALSLSPGSWPKTVIIKQSATFPALLNGKVVGSVVLPKGTMLRLIAVRGENVTVEYQGVRQVMAARSTNLIELVASSIRPAGRSSPMSIPDPGGHRPALQAGKPLPKDTLYPVSLTETAAYSPGEKLIDPDIIQRSVHTNIKAEPEIHLYFRLPLGVQEGRPVAGVLAFCTWEQEPRTLIGHLKNRRDALVKFADAHDLAMITWNTATVWNKQKSFDEMSWVENARIDRDFDVLASAWDRGIRTLCRENNLPDNDFLLYGISRGAQWAHRLALRKPERFLAVHIHINSSYDKPTPAAKRCLWLQTTGELEAGYAAARRFYADCLQLGYPIIFKAGENLGHASSPQIEALRGRFFEYALMVKAARDTLLKGKPSLNRGAAPDLLTLGGFRSPPYVADYLNQEVFPIAKADLVPPALRVAIPNQQLAKAWGPLEK